MASSAFADASGSRGPRFFELLYSFGAQARLALGTRGVLWATAAGAVGLACCLVAFADIGLSLHRSDVDPQRRRAREVLALDNASRLLMRDLLARSGASRPVGADSQVGGEPWKEFVLSLEALCRDFNVPPQTMLASTCMTQPAFERRVGAAVAAVDRQSRPLDPATLRELLSLRDDISELSLTTTRSTDATIGRLVDDYTNALVVLTLCTSGFACAGLILILLVGRASMDYHAQWRRAMAAAGDAGAARDLLDEVIEALPAGVVVYDADERLKMFNTMAQQLTPALNEPGAIGKTYEMLANDSARRLVAAGMGPQPVDEWIDRFRSKTTERQRQSQDGRWYEWSEKATASGLTVGLRIDVTDIKRHELEIEEARTRYQTLVDLLQDMVYAVDWRGNYTYVSPGAAGLLGVAPDKVIGTRFKDWIVPEDVERVIAGGRACHYSPSLEQRRTNFRIRAADGTIRPVELRFRKNSGNDPNAAQVGVIRDVTELEHARAEYQSLVDSLADVAYRLDVETGKYTFVSAAGEDFFGVPPEKMVGSHFLDYIAPESREQVGGTTLRPYHPDDPGTFTRFSMIGAGGADPPRRGARPPPPRPGRTAGQHRPDPRRRGAGAARGAAGAGDDAAALDRGLGRRADRAGRRRPQRHHGQLGLHRAHRHRRGGRRGPAAAHADRRADQSGAHQAHAAHRQAGRQQRTRAADRDHRDAGGRRRRPGEQHRAAGRRRHRAPRGRAGAVRRRALRHGGRDGGHHGARDQPAAAGHQPLVHARARGALRVRPGRGRPAGRQERAGIHRRQARAHRPAGRTGEPHRGRPARLCARHRHRGAARRSIPTRRCAAPSTSPTTACARPA